MPVRKPFRLLFIPVWKTAPLLRLVFPLMAGILWQCYLPISAFGLLALSACLLLGLTAWWMLSTKKYWLYGLLANAAMFTGGAWLIQVGNPRHDAWFAGRHYQPGQSVVAVLREPPEPRAKTIKVEVSVWLRGSSGQTRLTRGHAILYLEKDSMASALQYGQAIIFSQALQPIQNAGNPGGFNYAQYAAFQGVFYQGFLKKQQYRLLPGWFGSPWWRGIYQSRQWVLATLRQYLPDATTAGVAEALLVGYRGDLDKTLVEQYANAGVVHIIAISGMHLGLIYLVLGLIFSPLARHRKTRWINLLLILGCLWGFSLLTGAAPSITRAAVMFTVIGIGSHLKRKTSIYNSLSLAALVLLIHDPFALWNVGFQLSFAAVLSIAIFYAPIRQWWSPAFAPLRHTWELMAVTLAAQILTLPLAIYHFHQFPTWFLLANLVAVPLSTLLLYGLLLLLAISGWPWLASLWGKGLSMGIGWLNGFIQWVDQLPVSVVDGIYFPVSHILLLTACLLSMAWWWLRKSAFGGWWASVFLLTLMISRHFWQSSMARQHKLVVYNVSQASGIDLVQGSRTHFFGDTALAVPGFLSNFHLKPSRTFFQAKPSDIQMLADSNYLLQHAGKKILLLRQTFTYRQSQAVSADIVIVSGGVKGLPHRMLPFLKSPLIVLDGTVSNYRVRQWQNAADSLHLRLHSVALQGAFVLNMNSRPPPTTAR